MAKAIHPIIEAADAFYKEGKKLEAEGMQDLANSKYIESTGKCLLIIEPENTETIYDAATQAQAYHHRGRAYFSLGDSKDAQSDFLAAIAKDPSYAMPYNALGVIAHVEKDFATAEKYYQDALARDPSYAKTHYNLGLLLKEQVRYPEAEEAFTQAIALKPDDKSFYNSRGLCRMHTKPEKALEDFSTAIAIDSSYTAAYLHRAAVYSEKGLYNKVIEDTTVAIASGDKSDAYVMRGDAYLAKDDYRSARDDFSSVMSFSRDIEARNYAARQIESINAKMLRQTNTAELKKFNEGFARRAVKPFVGRA